MGSVDRDRIRAAVGEILAAIGEDPAREGLRDTPRRVAELYGELFAGVGDDPADAFGGAFALRDGGSDAEADRAGSSAAKVAGLPDADGDADASAGDADAADEALDRIGSVVLMRDLAFRSICEHHLLPFEGVVHIAYEPDAELAGLGRFAAVVEVASSRPQLQERLGDDIADAVERGLTARGVLVVIEARHGCVTARGPRQTASTTVTLSARGSLADPAARAEVMALVARS
ncbi:GTP cyclohydrolase I [Cnuibacter physcomitrellae]|uniref:GTP cyclohydrolase I n=1 Tax=Cnuibacter physcomitrellae TaxID=1619308 RepID=UPI0021761D37|nr:GTP cyclohydrolase I [Cnuibacter physcomitrellae]MCS5498983.1 GTP cyclohydrolase I [Cnuibacter physcomitrellae]